MGLEGIKLFGRLTTDVGVPGRAKEGGMLMDYVRISKLRIIFLLDFVAISALIVAGGLSLPLSVILGLLVAGTLSSAGASAINCYLDRDIDSIMSRTKGRPIPLGRLSPGSALTYGIVMLALALTISFLTLNLVATSMILLGAFFYVAIYTVWLKRRTTWNIVIGGFAGSAAAFAGWAAATGTVGLQAILMGGLIFLWTPSHFWSLAVLNNKDYESAGVPMLPAVVGENKAVKFIGLNTLMLLPFSFLFIVLGFHGLIYALVASTAGALLLVTNIRMLMNVNASTAWTAFKYSSPYLAFVFLGMILDTLIIL